MKLITLRISVTGLVQGVGFRPFVYRIAVKNSISGWVRNTNENVMIEATGKTEHLDTFLISLRDEAPPAADIQRIDSQETDLKIFNGFSILESSNLSDETTEISPDIAVCADCLADMDNQHNRIGYPFVNCTSCGPRFTIIEDLPYDRSSTTMKSFEMCDSCRMEFINTGDRRFHAQPVACNNCGPSYELLLPGESHTRDMFSIRNIVAEIIGSGGVVLIKGLGGMHLACDAFSEEAVLRLREIKRRDGKPFAVMFRDIESIRKYAIAGPAAEETLASWRRPIVLLEKKKDIEPAIPANISAGLNLVGAMLPYMPIHYMIFSKLKSPAIVLTSGNLSNEPIIISDSEAKARFSSITDAVLLHNREIYNRTDDSVVRISDEKERIVRRSRGYVPAPVRTGMNADGIVAFGAELANCFCMGKGEKAYLSQHIGDLQTAETEQFYLETIDRFIKLFRIKPSLLATDMHPGYISTKTALAFGDLPITRIQHHHAHTASCMAENKLEGDVIGVAFDGTGYGTDGNTWGSEFLICDYLNFSRESHFEYLPMPGGDSASEEPWRMAVSWLYKVYGNDLFSINIPPINITDREHAEVLVRMMQKKINCPLSSGTGRFFDAVSSLTGLVQKASFHAEGPMRLESLTHIYHKDSYPFQTGETICLSETLKHIVKDILAMKPASLISTRFHNTIILIIFETVSQIRNKTGLNRVVLSGGVFQNCYLLSGTSSMLRKNGFEVYTHSSVPANDGGIALGQLAVASKRREVKCV